MGKGELRIDPQLLAQAQSAGVHVEEVTERALREALRNTDATSAQARAAQWAEQNAQAIAAHKERIEKYGVFGDDLRTW